MKRNLDIQKEWESIGAKFSVQIGLPLFSVPANYFEHLPNKIMDGINAISTAESTLAPIENPYQVPATYFDQLSDSLLSSTLAAHQIMESVHIDGFSKSNVYDVPNDYFANFADTVIAQINEEEDFEDELLDSPLLASLKGSNPFEEEEQKEIVVEKIQASTKEKTEIEVPMAVRKRLRMSTWMAAASVAIFFILGAGWLILDNRPTDSNNLARKTYSNPDVINKKLAALPDAEIEAYLDQNIDEFSEYLLEDYVSNASVNTKYSAEKALNNISDAELEAYLNNNVY